MSIVIWYLRIVVLTNVRLLRRPKKSSTKSASSRAMTLLRRTTDASASMHCLHWRHSIMVPWIFNVSHWLSAYSLAHFMASYRIPSGICQFNCLWQAGILPRYSIALCPLTSRQKVATATNMELVMSAKIKVTQSPMALSSK